MKIWPKPIGGEKIVVVLDGKVASCQYSGSPPLLLCVPESNTCLVAAKSILRFSETREDQRMAEYVLIGTLMSFALAIAAALLTQKCPALWPALVN